MRIVLDTRLVGYISSGIDVRIQRQAWDGEEIVVGSLGNEESVYILNSPPDQAFTRACSFAQRALSAQIS